VTNDFDSRVWSDDHHRLSLGIGGIFNKLAYAFKRLQAIEYDAPWEREAERIRETLPKRHQPAEPTIGRAATFR
jgi:hypothetical protein